MSSPIRNLEGAAQVAALTRETTEATTEEAVQRRLEELGDENEFRQFSRREDMKARKPQVLQAISGATEKDEEAAKDAFQSTLLKKARDFQVKFGDLDADKVVAMRNAIVGDGKTERNRDEILAMVKIYFPIPADTDAALQFLIDMGQLPPGMISEATAARAEHHQKNTVEVLFGTSVSQSAEELQKLGLGTPKDMKALFNRLINNPPADAREMGRELLKYFPDPVQLKEAGKYIHRETGIIFRTYRAEIPPGLLYNAQKMDKQVAAVLFEFAEFKQMDPFLKKQYVKLGLTEIAG